MGHCGLDVTIGSSTTQPPYYRRLLGDLAWPHEQESNTVLSYWHDVPVTAIRVCKSDIGCGIDTKVTKRVQKDNSHFMTAGIWGMIQFYNPESKHS